MRVCEGDVRATDARVCNGDAHVGSVRFDDVNTGLEGLLGGDIAWYRDDVFAGNGRSRLLESLFTTADDEYFTFSIER